MFPIQRTILVTLAILIALSMLALLAPLPFSFPSPSLDAAWVESMNESVARGMVFGRDVAFTYGPYAAAYTHQFHPATVRGMVLVDLLFGLSYGGGLIQLSGGSRRWLAFALPVALLFAAGWFEPLLMCLPLLHVLLVDHAADAFRQRTAPRLALLPMLGVVTVALGFLPLVKGSFMILAVLGITGSFLITVRPQPFFAWAGLFLWLAALVGGWCAAGQPVTALPGYFTSMVPIVSGYTEAMSTWLTKREPLYYLAAALFIVACCIQRLMSRHDRASLLLSGAAAITLFLVMKEGFVRDDLGHTTIASTGLIVVAFLVALRLPPLTATVAAAAGLVGWAMVTHAITRPAPQLLVENARNTIEALPQQLSEALDGRAAGLFDLNEAKIVQAYPLKPRDGTVDIYPIDQSIVLAHHMRWSPRSILQSYSAYGHIADLDAEHLRGPHAPDFVYFAPGAAIDGRLPTLGDGPSWLPLTTDYRLIDKESGFAVLQHKPGAPTPPPLGPMTESEHALGEKIALPDSDKPLWAEIDIRPTRLGRLANLLYKPGDLYLVMTFANGSTERYRYIPNMGRSGFLLSPVVATTEQFLAFLSPVRTSFLAGRRPVSFSLETGPDRPWFASRAWRSRFTIRLRSFTPPPQPAASAMLFDPWLAEPPAGFTADAATIGRCNIDAVTLNRVGAEEASAARSLLHVNGWTAISVEDGVAPDAIYVVAETPDGVRRIARARQFMREDVNVYFQRPQLGSTGFDVTLSLPADQPDARVRIAESHNGAINFCPEVRDLKAGP